MMSILLSLYITALLFPSATPEVITQLNLRHVNQPSADDLVPVYKIIGTDIYTGIFYQVGIKRFPKATVTYTDQLSSQGMGYYVQVDDSSGNVNHYKPGGKFYNDGQWLLEHSSGDSLVLKNRPFLKNPVTTQKESKSGDTYLHLIIPKDSTLVANVSPGGSKEEETYMNITQTDDPGKYNIQIKWGKYPKGSVTWTELTYGTDKYYIQIADVDGTDSRYKPGGSYWGDTLFSFTPVHDHLDYRGFVSYMELTDSPKVLLDKYEKHIRVEYKKKTTLTNGQCIKQSTIVTFGDNEADNTDATVSIEDALVQGMNLSGVFRIPTLRAWDNDVTLRDTLYVIQPKTLESDKATDVPVSMKWFNGTEFEKEIHVSNRKTVEVYIARYYLSDIELPFRATVTVTADGDRLLTDHSGTKRGPMPPEVIMSGLDSSKVPSDNRRIVGDKVMMWVQGVLKGTVTIGFDIITLHK